MSKYKIKTEIQLTRYGDFLITSQEMREYYTPKIIGRHKYCTDNYNGTMKLRQTSKQKNTIYCNTCNFRIEIPLIIDNFEKIEKYFKNKFENIDDKIKNRAEILDL